MPPYFSVRDISWRHLCDGYEITVTTDIACNLTMRWTNVQPQIHKIPVLRRGLFMHGDTYFCFVAYHDNAQEEAGDTITHTFIKRGWAVCETRWFYFWGSEAGIAAPSTTAIWKLHFDILSMLFPPTSSCSIAWNTSVSWSACHDAGSAFRLYAGAIPNYWQQAGDVLTASYFIYRAFLYFNTSSLPTPIVFGEAILSLYIGVLNFGDLTHPYIYATKGVQGDPLTLPDYGGQLPETNIHGQLDLATTVLNAYNTITLNTLGRANINTLGTTRLCIRGQRDLEDDPSLPVYANTIAYHNYQIGPVKRAFLTICYAP